MVEKNEKKKKRFEDAMDNYERIRSSLKGLYDIVKIVFNEKDFYYLAAIDNLKGLNESLIEILKDSHSPREVRMRLREIEFDEIEFDEIDYPL